MELFILVAAVVLTITFVAYIRRGQVKMHCPQCDSASVRTVERQLKELKQDQTIGYAVKLDVQLIMETQYRCKACEHSWSMTAPET